MESGTSLGSYQIVSPLGAGGMGKVYRATDTTLNRESAIKVLLAEVLGRDDYAVTADGQRFLVKTRVEEEDRRIHVVLNWTSLLE